MHIIQAMQMLPNEKKENNHTLILQEGETYDITNAPTSIPYGCNSFCYTKKRHWE